MEIIVDWPDIHGTSAGRTRSFTVSSCQALNPPLKRPQVLRHRMLVMGMVFSYSLMIGRMLRFVYGHHDGHVDNSNVSACTYELYYESGRCKLWTN